MLGTYKLSAPNTQTYTFGSATNEDGGTKHFRVGPDSIPRGTSTCCHKLGSATSVCDRKRRSPSLSWTGTGYGHEEGAWALGLSSSAVCEGDPPERPARDAFRQRS